jgi:hypothetical protein
VGRFKARVFAALGFDAKAAEAFVWELRRLAATGEVASVEDVGSAGSTLLDTVVLTHDLPEHGLRAGTSVRSWRSTGRIESEWSLSGRPVRPRRWSP